MTRARTTRRTGTGRRRPVHRHRPGTTRTCQRCRDRWTILSVPVPFAKTRRKWRRSVKRFTHALGIAFWIAIGLLVAFFYIRGHLI